MLGLNNQSHVTGLELEIWNRGCPITSKSSKFKVETTLCSKIAKIIIVWKICRCQAPMLNQALHEVYCAEVNLSTVFYCDWLSCLACTKEKINGWDISRKLIEYYLAERQDCSLDSTTTPIRWDKWSWVQALLQKYLFFTVKIISTIAMAGTNYIATCAPSPRFFLHLWFTLTFHL